MGKNVVEVVGVSRVIAAWCNITSQWAFRGKLVNNTKGRKKAEKRVKNHDGGIQSDVDSEKMQGKK